LKVQRAVCVVFGRRAHAMHWLIRSWRAPTRPVGSATLGIPAESALAQPVPLPLFSDVDTKQTMSSRECYERLFGWQWNNKDNLIFNAMLQLCHRKEIRTTDYLLLDARTRTTILRVSHYTQILYTQRKKRKKKLADHLLSPITPSLLLLPLLQLLPLPKAKALYS